MAWTEAARKKAAETRKQRGTVNGYAKAKLEGKSGKATEETKKKISASRLGQGHSEETKQLLHEKALASGHRRLLKSTRIYTKKDGTKVLLDSSWEEALAVRLDEMGIEWERPKEPLKWVDSSGAERNYFPDFYLPEHCIYLDPKNDHAFNVQSEKIQFFQRTRDDIIFIRTLKECQE